MKMETFKEWKDQNGSGKFAGWDDRDDIPFCIRGNLIQIMRYEVASHAMTCP